MKKREMERRDVYSFNLQEVFLRHRQQQTRLSWYENIFRDEKTESLEEFLISRKIFSCVVISLILYTSTLKTLRSFCKWFEELLEILVDIEDDILRKTYFLITLPINWVLLK